jgi:tRNA(His) 5'-end guanylyltransferase
MDKPYDEILCKSMQDTMKYLCENIQNCVLGYTQSDEITLVLCDYKKINTAAWFDNNVRKMCSVSASLATLAFNRIFAGNTQDAMFDCCYDPKADNIGDEVLPERQDDYERYKKYMATKINQATFDSRVFNIPITEVCNCLIWRQQDAIRNSIQGLGQKHFSHRQLEGKNCNQIQDMLMLERGINWNNVPPKFKRGSCCVKTDDGWIIDNEIPIFTQDRDYIESRIIFEGYNK